MKNIIIRIVIVALFLTIALICINTAPQYDLVYKFKNGDLRVIYNDKEITRETSKLPQVAVMLNGEVMLSQDTIDILFDKDLFYEKKHDTLITTCYDHRADIKVDSRTILIDGEEKAIKVPAVKSTYKYNNDDRYNGSIATKEVIYVPIKELAKVYNIDVEFKDKIIITDKSLDYKRFVVKKDGGIELKHTTSDNAKVVQKVSTGNYIDIFNYDNSKDYNVARSYDGEIGYVRTADINDVDPIEMKVDRNVPDKVEGIISLAWDYLNPDFQGIGDKSSRRKVSKLDIVAPTLLYLQNTDGEVTYRIKTVDEYKDWVKGTNYKVWVTFKNDSNSISETSEFLNDMNHRNTAIKELISFAHKYDVQGINVDFENMYKSDATVFSQFIRELAVETRRNNLILSVDVNVPDGSDTWSLCYEHKALSEAADYIALMSYDQYGSSSKVAGPNASYEWVASNLEKLITRDHVEPSKLLLGIAFYSRLWSNKSGNFTSNTINMEKAKTYIAKSEWDNDAKQYYYEKNNEYLWIEDKTSIAEKLKLIEEYGLGGFACWRLGFESEDVWNAF